MDFLFLIVGLAGLLISSNLIIRAARNLANFLRVSELFVGLTFVAIGTSLPEIAVNVASGIKKLGGIDASGIAVGDVVGASINLFTIILGLISILGTIIIVSRKKYFRDTFALLFTVLVFFIMSLDYKITRVEGIILLLLYVFYLYNLGHDELTVARSKEKRRKPVHLLLDISLLVGGIALIIYSSNTVVSGGVAVARNFQISDALIGLLIVGLGTSLPELSISFLGILKKSYQLSLGNLMGSVVCNFLLAAGLGATISGFNVEKSIVSFDVPFLFFILLLALLFLKRKERIFKWEGLILVLIYLIYLGSKLFLM